MLTRTLEPEVMDTPDEAADYDSMDHSAVNRLFATDFLFAALEAGLLPDSSAAAPPASGLSSLSSPEILDLGTGTAQIPIELCRRATGVRVRAVELAEEMLRIARRNVEAAGLTDRITLDQADAKKLTYADGQFAALMSNSIVHHIPNRVHVLAEAVRVVRGGGLIFIRDLLRPGDDKTVRHLVATYAGDATEHQRAMFEASLRAALDLDEIRGLVAELGYAKETVQATSDRHWTWIARR